MDVHSRQIPGWRTARMMTTSLVADAIEHAIWTQRREGITYCLDSFIVCGITTPGAIGLVSNS
ncbi:hypothetical protein [Rhodococcus sp. P-2]|uniref:hypothetical protein n=1 Tax=Rhodococcus sp. P-2 TaxID=2795031 RepID=UPI003FA359F8